MSLKGLLVCGWCVARAGRRRLIPNAHFGRVFLSLRRPALEGRKGLRKASSKSVAAFEIVAAVGLAFVGDLVFYHIENDFAEILAGMNTPFFEHGGDHGAKTFQGVEADAVEQFLAADVGLAWLCARPKARWVCLRASCTNT